MTGYKTVRRQGAPADLDFSVQAPEDWVPIDVPDEVPDFDDPLAFAPIGVLMAPFAAILFAVAGRPAYADGCVAQWLQHVAGERGLDPGAIERVTIGPHEGVACWGVQVENGTPLRARIVFFEDGGRLVTVSCLAPASLWSAVDMAFTHMLATFALAKAHGARFPVLPEAPKAKATESSVALAADTASLAEDHPMNARLRDTGVGLVPRVLRSDPDTRVATLAPAALVATLGVPFGWHVIDDGRRTLVFDAEGAIQVNLQRVPRQGRSDDTIFEEKLADLRTEWPALEHVRADADRVRCLWVRGGVVAGAPIQQGYLLRDLPPDHVLEVRLTSTPERFPQACELADALLSEFRPAEDSTLRP